MSVYDLTAKIKDLSLSSSSLKNSIIEDKKEEFSLLHHQKEALEFIKNIENDSLIKGGFLSMDCGLGKTFTLLNHLFTEKKELEKKELEKKEVEKKDRTKLLNLVVCPKTAMYTWKNEINKFYSDQLKVLVFHKDETNINKITKSKLNEYDIIITNYEFVRTVCSKLECFDKIRIEDNKQRTIGANAPRNPILINSKNNDSSIKEEFGERLLYSTKWHRIIADESHNFANLKTSLFESMICLCGLYKWCLSGTPIRNWSNDLYAQFKFLGYYDPEYSIKYFDTKIVLKYIYYCDYEKANIKLPDINYVNIGCELKDNNLKVYKYYLEKTSEAFDNFIVGSNNFSAILTLFLRLRQICVAPYIVTPSLNDLNEEEKKSYIHSQNELDKISNGLASWTNSDKNESGMESPKLKEIIKIIKSIPKGEKVVIFTMFKRVIDLISKKINSTFFESESELELKSDGKKVIIITGDVTGKNRDDAINDFKTSENCVLLINYRIGAESLNLTEANHIILVEPWWSFSVIKQATARVARLGQTKPINVYTLFVKNTKNCISIEEGMIELCNKKKKEAESVLSSTTDNDKSKGKSEIESGSINAETLYKLLNYTQTVKNKGT